MASRTRLAFVDNLRSTLIVWVVVFHTAIAYSHIGAWYWLDPGSRLDAIASRVFLTFETHSQAFFLGILFLVSGYFVPGAYDRKGARRFLADRFVRLGIPSLLYIFAIQPVIMHFLLGAGNGGFADYYLQFLRSADWTSGSGPMWFAIALLLFCAAYAGWRQIAVVRETGPAVPRLGRIVAAGAVIAVAAFLIRTVFPIGSSILYFQPPFFAQYVVLFIAGIAAFRGDWLCSFPTARGYTALAAAIVFTLMAWPALLWFGGGMEQGIAAYLGGWNWPNAGYAAWESIFCVLFSAGLLTVFRERFNATGRLSRLMADNAFAIYMLHPPVIIVVTMALQSVALPPLVKWPVAAACASVATLVCAIAVRRVPLLKKIL